MSGLTLNFKNAPKKPVKKPIANPKALNAFGASNSDDEDVDDALESGVFGGAGKKSKTDSGKKSDAKKKKDERTRMNAQLATFNEISKKAAESKPVDVDESVYDYDGVYESMQAAKARKKAAREAEAAEGKPKYMEALLTAAEVRKQDHLRAREKKLVKEREEEGEEFKDKEKFVTEAYKKQQEELKRLEEEERKREEKEKKGSSMTNFYRNILNRTEEDYEEALKASAEPGAVKVDEVPKTEDTDNVEELTKGRDAAEVARKIKEKFGGNVEINDEGEIVDKRQLLKGGLNITKAPQKPVVAAPGKTSGLQRPAQHRAAGLQASKEEIRARHTRMLEEQLSARMKREREEEDTTQQELELRAKSRKTETEVMSAKERYLQRKREREAAAAAAKGGSA